MKKTIFFFLIIWIVLLSILFNAVFITALVHASSLEIKKEAIYDTVTIENINIPAKYNFTVKNPNAYDDSFKIYTLLDARLTPSLWIDTPAGQEISVNATLLPLEALKKRCGEGSCRIQYYFKAEKSGVIEDSFLVKILPLNNIINVDTPESISRDDSAITLEIINKENINFKEVKFIFTSDFSIIEKNISIGPKSSQKINLELDTSKLKVAKAGDYKAGLKFFLNNEYNYIINKTITLKEFVSITETEGSKFTFFGFTKTITKKNEGNSPKFITIELTKNKFEHGFTSSNILPSSEESSRAAVLMKWQRELEPGESFTVEVHTDYTIPVMILILIIIVIVTIYLVKRPKVIIKKKAYRIMAKGGEFAIKIVLLVKNIGHEIKDVKCTDRLPHVTKLYERFGIAKPDKIEKNMLKWDFETLEPGGERVVSYILYSKIIPVGTMTIPRAVVTYIDKKGKHQVIYSNTLLVMGETEK